MPEFIEETPVVSPEQLSDERLPEREEPSLVEEVREEARIKEEERPLIAGKYKTPDEILNELNETKRQHEAANRRLEEFNQSERVRQARLQDAQEAQEREKAQIERSQRSRAVRQQAATLMEKGLVDEAADLMEAYHAQNAAYIAKAILEEFEARKVKPLEEQLSKYQLKEIEEQFIAHPDLEDIRHLSKSAMKLYKRGLPPDEIVNILRESNLASGGGRRQESFAANDNLVDMPSVRDQVRQNARSLSPGGGTAGPRRSAFDQEKLAEQAQRRKFLEETLGPLPNRKRKSAQ